MLCWVDCFQLQYRSKSQYKSIVLSNELHQHRFPYLCAHVNVHTYIKQEIYELFLYVDIHVLLCLIE